MATTITTPTTTRPQDGSTLTSEVSNMQALIYDVSNCNVMGSWVNDGWNDLGWYNSE